MSERRVCLIGHVPVPVGHRVEVTWYQVEALNVGLFGGETRETIALAAPIVIDLTTGIRYATLSHVSHQGGYQEGTINLEEHRLLAGLEAVDQVTGEVISCSVVSVRFEQTPGGQLETELVIRRDGAPFR